MYDYLILPWPAKSFCLKAQFFLRIFQRMGKRPKGQFSYSTSQIIPWCFFLSWLYCTLTVAVLY